MDNQIWGFLLSAVGLLGFLLAGKKVWWAWYVNIANQVLWTFYALVTEQLGFLVGTAFYFVVFIRNAYLWTKEHLEKKKQLSNLKVIRPRRSGKIAPNGMDLVTNPKPPKKGPVGPAGDSSERAQQPVVHRFTPKTRPASDIPNPPETHFKVDEEATASYMRYEGTDPAVSNEISFVVSDVMRNHTGGFIHPPFSLRYSIAHEVQRRLDVKLKGTRPDEKLKIEEAIHQIDKATSVTLVMHGVEYFETPKVEDNLGEAKRLLKDFLKGK